MKRPPTRLLLLGMGVFSAGLFAVGYVSGGKPDDALLVFAGSMFTTYALTEKRSSDDHDQDGDLDDSDVDDGDDYPNGLP